LGQFVFIANSGGGGAGAGDVVGPAGSNDGTIVLFDGITGKLIKDSGILPDPFTGDTGLGGVIGFVPAPAAGDAAANKFLNADGTWDTVPAATLFVGATIPPTVAGVQGIVPAPAIGDAASFKYLNADGTWEQITEDQVLPGFSINSFTKTAPNLAQVLYLRGTPLVGTTIAATYSAIPVSASLSNTLGGSVGGGDVNPGLWTFVAPFAGGTQPVNVVREGLDFGADPTWTIGLTATNVGTKAANLPAIVFTRQAFWGVSNVTPLTNADIVNPIVLANNVLATGFARTLTLSPAGEYVYYCYPAFYGPINSMKLGGIEVDLAPGAVLGISPSYTVAAVASGIPSTYNVYRSLNQLTGTNFNFVVT